MTRKTVRNWLMYVGFVLFASVLRVVWIRDEASGAMMLYGLIIGVMLGACLGLSLCAKLGHDSQADRT